MARQDYVSRINQAIQNREPYANSLANVVRGMNQHQMNYFLDVVAPYYMDGPGKSPYGMEYKDMEYMAKAVANNKDVSQVLGMDYRRLGDIVNQLPEISQQQIRNPSVQQTPFYQQQYAPQVKSDAQRIQDMNRMVEQYVLNSPDGKRGASNQTFCQSANVEYNRLPLQGWKFHISANSLQDYEKLLEKALPEFHQAGIAFKVVRPEQFEHQMQTSQAGKAITIYPTPDFDINRFSPELKSMLFEDGICPQGDAQIQGRICARYGQFRKCEGLVTQDGQIVPDPRGHVYKPEFVMENSPQEILNFYSDAARRYQETGDAKTYLQELVTLTQGNGYDSPWVILNVDPTQQNYANNIMQQIDKTGTSFPFQLGNQTYTMVNADVAPQILHELNHQGINFARPGWDERYNVYAMNSFEQAQELADMMKCNMDINGVPSIECVELPGGWPGIKVDTTMNKEMIQMCATHQIGIGEFCMNRDKADCELSGIKTQEIDKAIDTKGPVLWGRE